MASPNAIFAAVDLADMPILAALMRDRPLPPRTLTLIQIAAGDGQATSSSAKAVDRSKRFVKSASRFYIRQVLWSADADHYRVLGLSRGASDREIKEHFHWLMKWLHPDVNHEQEASIALLRVMAAWSALRTSEGRRRYDENLAIRSAQRQKRRTGEIARRRIPWVANSMRSA